MTTPPAPSTLTPSWQSDKHLQSGDCFLVLTDIERFSSQYLPWSEPQELFRVGIYDLRTKCLGYANFGKDIAFAILKAGIAPPPWTAAPLPGGIELHRAPHDGEEKGRYQGWATIIDLEPEVHAMAGRLKASFAHGTSTPNALVGMWKDLEERARRENAIEAAVNTMSGPFAAGDIKKIVGKDVDVTPVLKRLVAEGRLLPPTGKKRGTRYMRATPRLVERSDWAG